MSVYHTPRCRITWTNVHSGGVNSDFVPWHLPLTLFFGLEFDPALRALARSFELRFDLFEPGHSFVGGGTRWGGINQLPGTTGRIWLAKTFEHTGQALDYRWGTILYRPSMHFSIGTGRSERIEFAVAEEDHYIYSKHLRPDSD